MRLSEESQADKLLSACVFGHCHRILVTILLFGSQPSPALPISRFPFAASAHQLQSYPLAQITNRYEIYSLMYSS
jgi:hypothetical protein